jgi:Skp family chaperone for outer membrane proteins
VTKNPKSRFLGKEHV